VRTDRLFQPLTKGDYQRAVSLLNLHKGGHWAAERFQVRALAYMGLNNWEAALTDIDAALSQRAADSRHKRAISLGEAEMHFAKSTILKKLGRDEEAAKERTTAEQYNTWLENQPPDDEGHVEKPPSYARYGVPVGVYDDFLKRMRVGLSEEGKKTE